MTADLILRLLVSALLGGAIGFERSYRAKEAGIRTEIMEKPSPMPVQDPKFHPAGASQGGHGDEC